MPGIRGLSLPLKSAAYLFSHVSSRSTRATSALPFGLVLGQQSGRPFTVQRSWMSSTASSPPPPPELKYKRPEPKPEVKEGFAWEMIFFGITAAAAISYDVYYTLYVHEPAAELLFPDEFNEFCLSEVVPVNHDTSLFKFKAKVLPVIKGSQVAAPSHVVIKDDSCQIARAYTPISFLKDSVEILVKKYPGGSISPMLHGLKVGEKVHMRGPITTLPYRPNVVKELGMIAGGTGITPMYQLIKSILYDPEDVTRIHLVYANKSLPDVLLYQELEKLQETFPDRLSVFYTLEDHPGAPYERFGTGRVSQAMLSQNLPPPRLQDKDTAESAVLICGPDGFVQAVAGPKESESRQGPLLGHLKSLGFSPHQVYKL